MDDLISRLSEIRSNYNCMDEAEEPYYRALSEAIQLVSAYNGLPMQDLISRQAAIDFFLAEGMKMIFAHMQKGEPMVADNQIQVWQDGSKESGYVLKVQSRYLDDPMFTLEQEGAIHEIVRSFLLVNRQTERRRRYAEKKKAERRTDGEIIPE